MDQAEGKLGGWVYRKEIIEFIVASKEYCYLLSQEGEGIELDKVHRLLSLVYTKFLVCEEHIESCYTVEEGLGDQIPDLPVPLSQEQYYELLKRVEAKLPEEESMGGQGLEQGGTIGAPREGEPLAELLCDIYQPLYDCLINYSTGDELSMGVGLKDCYKNFYNYFGSIILKVFSRLLEEHGGIDEDTDI